MRIAIVSTGLGHVARGIEVWAATLAAALARRGYDVALFKGSGKCAPVNEKIIRGLPRGSRLNRALTAVCSRCGGWRFGFGSEYQTEQTAFAPGLVRALRAEAYDLVHLQDPWLALLLERARIRGRHRARVILAHGTEEDAAWLARFPHVQELSPHYLQRHKQPWAAGCTRHVIPNFVDIEVFKPGDKQGSRATMGFPADAFTVLSVGAINRQKQTQRVVDEVAWVKEKPLHLVLAGSSSGCDESILDDARQRLGERFHWLPDVDHASMPALYAAADLFVLASPAEIFGIAFLEAMACGIPCVGHTYPVTRWIIGDGGICVDMTKTGTLADIIRLADDPAWREDRGCAARARVEEHFSEAVVVEQIIGMYGQVMERDEKDEGEG